jgi:hypothetical protein
MLIPYACGTNEAARCAQGPLSVRTHSAGRGRTERGLGAGGFGLKIFSAILALGLASMGCDQGRPDAGSSAGVSVGATSSRERVAVRSKSAVVEAYSGFFAGVGRALQAPPERVRGILAELASGSYLDFEIRQVIDHQARGLEAWGRPVVHVTDVELGPASARVHDCQNASPAGLADVRTHRLVPQSRGDAHRNLVAYLRLGGDQQWRVTDLVQHKASCHRS